MPLTGFNCWPDPRLDAVTLKVNENSSFETGRADWATQPFVRVVTIAATEPNPSVGGRLWSPFSLSVGRVVTERVDTKSAMKNSKALRASQAQRSNARFLLIGKLLIPHDDGGRVSQLNECPSQPASASVYVCMWMWVYRRCQLRKNPEWANETSGTLRCRYCCSWWVSLARNVHWEDKGVLWVQKPDKFLCTSHAASVLISSGELYILSSVSNSTRVHFLKGGHILAVFGWHLHAYDGTLILPPKRVSNKKKC